MALQVNSMMPHRSSAESVDALTNGTHLRLNARMAHMRVTARRHGVQWHTTAPCLSTAT
jgi:hypothetical protein